MKDTRNDVALYQDAAGEWRWSRRIGGDVVADSGEGYEHKTDAKEEAMKLFPEIEIVEIDTSEAGQGE